jgi:FkbM family methyltransferase
LKRVGYCGKNLEINALNNITQIFEHALGSTEADIAFTVGRDTENRIADPGDLNVRTVQQRTLDTITGDRHPIMMKLDVEGSEDAVLQGAAACISKKSLLAIQAESVSEYFEATLNQEGFRRAYYDPYRRELSNVPTKFLSANTLFVRDEQAIAERLIGASKVDVLGQRI